MFRAKQNLSVFIRGDIEIRTSSIHGRGVFATADIPANWCIEICPAILFTNELLHDWHHLMKEKHILSDHVFGHRKGELGQAIVFGYGSIYNHSIENNAHFRWSETMEEPAVEFWSTKDIKKGEEIFTRYCKREEDEWFWVD